MVTKEPDPQHPDCVNDYAGKHKRIHVAKRIIRVLLLILTVCAVWLTIEHRWGNNFQFPTRYMGDSHYVLGMMKLAKQGDLGLFNHIKTKSLGAPFEGQLNDFIQTERVLIWLGGQIARVTGLIPAANAMLILSCVTSAVSFYCASRLWKLSRLSSWGLAVVYAFLPQSQRSLDHLGIAFSGILPLQFYCLWYISTIRSLSWRSSRLKITFAIATISGLLNIYWIFLFIQIYILAIIYRIIKYRSAPILSLLPLLVTIVVAILPLGSFVIYRENYRENTSAIVRSYFDIERWSLRPIDLLIPKWGTYLPISSEIASRYYRGRLKVGEVWGAYVGICSLLGLLLLFSKSIQRQLNKRSPSLPYLLTCWIIAYSSLGGIHAIDSIIFNFYDIRGTNRYSAAIATLGLLYFTFYLNYFTRSWSLKGKILSLIFLISLAILDQSFTTNRYPFDINFSIKNRVIGDKKLVLMLEEQLRENAMIYMLPAVDCPEPFEGRGAYKLNSFFYNSMRPFLYSSKLRYSYGSNKGREGADWQLDVQELAAGEVAATLESYGFSGILLDRKGYIDRGAQILADFDKAGWPIEFEQGVDNEWVFIRLRPSETPVLPTLTPYAISEKN